MALKIALFMEGLKEVALIEETRYIFNYDFNNCLIKLKETDYNLSTVEF